MKWEKFSDVKKCIELIGKVEGRIRQLDQEGVMKDNPLLLVTKVYGKVSFFMIDKTYHTDSAINHIEYIVVKNGKTLEFKEVSSHYALAPSYYSKLVERMDDKNLVVVNDSRIDTYSDVNHIKELFLKANRKQYLEKYKDIPNITTTLKFADLDTLPKGLESFLKEQATFKSGILTYRKERGSIISAVCSICGNNIANDVPDYLQRGYTQTCSCCRNSLDVFSAGQSQDYRKPYNNTVIVQKVNGLIYLRILSSEGRHFNWKQVQKGIISISREGEIRLYEKCDKFSIKSGEINQVYWKTSIVEHIDKIRYLFHDIHNVYGLTQGLIADSVFKYMELDEIKHHILNGSIFTYMLAFRNCPIIETYEKNGLSLVNRDFIKNEHDKQCSSTRKYYDIKVQFSDEFFKTKFLGFWKQSFSGKLEKFYSSSRTIALAKKYNMNLRQLTAFAGKYYASRVVDSKGKEIFPVFTDEEFELFYVFSRNIDEDNVQQLAEYVGTKMGAVCAYLATQKVDHSYTIFVQYRDYLRMRKQVHSFNKKYPKSKLSKWPIYPADFMDSHDKIVEEYDLCTDLQDEYAYAGLYSKIAHYEYVPEESEYMIKIPETASQIVQEGKALSHCVKSYISDMLARKLIIAFVRKKDDPDESLYTLEYSYGRIRQLRGFKNADAPKDVEEFAKTWVQHLNTLEEQKQAS